MKTMGDDNKSRPKRFASQRAKALFLGEVTSQQLYKEQRDLEKALQVSLMEARRAAKVKRNEIQSIKGNKKPINRSTNKMVNKKRKSEETTTSTPSTPSKASKRIKINQNKPFDDVKSDKVNQFNKAIQNDSNKQQQQEKKQVHHLRRQDHHDQRQQQNEKMIVTGKTTGDVAAGDSVNCLKTNGLNCDKPRPRIMAQRKFASYTNHNAYLKPPRDTDFSSIKELFTKHIPSTEDFLTFLCFRNTDYLPPHLDFYALNGISSKPKDCIPTTTSSSSSSPTASNTTTTNNTTIETTVNANNGTSQSTSISTSKPHNYVVKDKSNKIVTRKKAASDSPDCTLKDEKKKPNLTEEKVKIKMKKLNNEQVGAGGGNNQAKERRNSRKLIEGMKKPKVKQKRVTEKVIHNTRACKTSTKPIVDQCKPKKSPQKTSPPQSRSLEQQKQTKVLKTKKKQHLIDVKSGPANSHHVTRSCKVKRKTPSHSKVSNEVKKASLNVSCDRILRSGRKSDSAPKEASTSLSDHHQKSPVNKALIRKKVTISHKPGKRAMICSSSPKKPKIGLGKCDIQDLPDERSKKKMTQIISSERRPKIKSKPLSSVQSREKGQIKVISGRIETRSVTKR